MQALVVSAETEPGGKAINKGRVRLGFKPLSLVVVTLVAVDNGSGKVSSSQLRERDAAKAAAAVKAARQSEPSQTALQA
jgi:pantetheine-phosphate adenylyltransferase